MIGLNIVGISWAIGVLAAIALTFQNPFKTNTTWTIRILIGAAIGIINGIVLMVIERA